MALYRDEGIVLRTYKLGEADRIVVLLTRGHGKVRAVAKGVRKTKSRDSAAGSSRPRISSCSSTRGAASSTSSTRPRRSTTSGPSATTSTGSPAPSRCSRPPTSSGSRASPTQRSSRCCSALRSLAGHRSPLVVAGYFLKLLALEGFRPVVDECVVGAADTLVAFDVDAGGTRCQAHRRGVPISAWRSASCDDILGGRLAQALATGVVRHDRGGALGDPCGRAPPRAPSALGLGSREALIASGRLVLGAVQ